MQTHVVAHNMRPPSRLRVRPCTPSPRRRRRPHRTSSLARRPSPLHTNARFEARAASSWVSGCAWDAVGQRRARKIRAARASTMPHTPFALALPMRLESVNCHRRPRTVARTFICISRVRGDEAPPSTSAITFGLAEFSKHAVARSRTWQGSSESVRPRFAEMVTTGLCISVS